ncbi:hypothetical protein EOD42_09100 [Rhodovarius crocodyli]|uniref:Flippase-like domain-containing protein n=1 Tax=Rhodovarius crocodyli TaxID=1979269 RepID=A0A437MJW6_9PROT|nr:lysylphosphatidylglycerol synthase domain-containing protein [Rhodovarius crocodyli]RVT97932.1 hypothetical protein EOD42_09100 [Rhodovarius crocodyli]
MNRIGLIAAVAGLGFAVWVVWQQDWAEVSALLAGAGASLFLVAFAHVLPMAVNAQAWAMLIPGAKRPSLPGMTLQVWIRESINGLLPVGRIGGEVVCFRLLRRWGVRGPAAAGSMMADLALSMISQMLFSLLGLALLSAGGAVVGWLTILLGTLAGLLLAGATIMAMRANWLSRAIDVLNGLAKDRLAGLAAGTRRLDTYMRRLWRRPRAAVLCTVWQFAAWVVGAVEIWVAGWALGLPISWADALMIEALIQALSSAAFLVPGALGIQEAGFVGLAVLAGLPPAAGAALGLARRFRDVVVFLPGLAAWAWMERSGK